MKTRMPSSPQDRNHPPIEELYRMAAQYSRRQDEVDDLVQDLLLEAIRTGRDFREPRFLAWGRGFLRNRAAFIARTEGRRRKREGAVHQQEEAPHAIRLPERFIARLCPSLRVTARLINCGLSRKEILCLLDIADTALRQRLTALRREWKVHLDAVGQPPDAAEMGVCTLPSGLIRRSLVQVFRHTAGRYSPDRTVGSHDPDGHLFTIRTISAHKNDIVGNSNPDHAGEDPV